MSAKNSAYERFVLGCALIGESYAWLVFKLQRDKLNREYSDILHTAEYNSRLCDGIGEICKQLAGNA